MEFQTTLYLPEGETMQTVFSQASKLYLLRAAEWILEKQEQEKRKR